MACASMEFFFGMALRTYLGVRGRRSVFGRQKWVDVLIFFVAFEATPLSAAFLDASAVFLAADDAIENQGKIRRFRMDDNQTEEKDLPVLGLEYAEDIKFLKFSKF